MRALFLRALPLQMCDDDILATHTPETLKSGSTAVVVLIRRTGTATDPTTIYCANVGDSKAVLCRNGTAVEMSYDHKPSRSDERQRIIESGGTVIKNRLYGVLGVSRSFGDLRFKNQVVSHTSVCWHLTWKRCILVGRLVALNGRACSGALMTPQPVSL